MIEDFGDAMQSEQQAMDRPGSDAIALDPFSFHGHHVASRIAGLGGDQPADQDFYVFHTPYVAVARGRAKFWVHLKGLSGRVGTLVIRVHMLPDEPGSVASMVNAQRVALTRLEKDGGRTSVSFESFSGMTFALVGMIHEETDAAATGLVVMVETQEVRGRGALQDARSTQFEATGIKSVRQLVTMARPTLATPSSQGFTPAQLGEKLFRKWMRTVGEVRQPGPVEWGWCYTLQVLERYGVLAPGARGLVLAETPDPVPAAIVAAGASIVVAYPQASDADWPALAMPAICDPAAWQERAVLTPVDIAALPEELVNFDFLVTSGVTDRAATFQELLDFVDDALDSVRPGGLALFLLRARPATAAVIDGEIEPWHPSRLDLDKLAMMIVSMGHNVAQLRPGVLSRLHTVDQAREATTLFGIVVRKARSAL